MDRTQILILVAVLAVFAIRLYQKYWKKSKGKSSDANRRSSASEFSSSSKDDDYEPYSKR